MVDPMRKASLVLVLLLLMPWASADVVTWQGPETTPDDAGLEPSNSTHVGFTIPANSTITDSSFEIAPVWVEAEDNGTYWAGDSPGGFSVGTANGTSYLGSSGDLTLAPVSSHGEMTDFEVTTEQFSSWAVQGDPILYPVNLTAAGHGPTDALDGHHAAGTNGTVLPGSYSAMRSQFWNLPEVIRHLNLSFARWISLDSDDNASVEVSHDDGQSWDVIDWWNGSQETWVNETYTLDSMQLGSTIGFRFIINTSTNSGIDEGMFIDSFNLSNRGEPMGAWFHGNDSGQYAVWASGSLVIPVDLSGLTGPLEFVYWANWDIEADYNDNMVVMVSLDNGSTWTIMSPLPGVPGLGVPSGGTTYTQQTYGWRLVHHPFPSWAAGHINASQALLRFHVTTDGVKNHGGSAIDGWEGIMIDDLAVQSMPTPGQVNVVTFDNLTGTTGHYLQSVNGSANEWQHVTWEGHNGPWHTADSFESVQALPFGWRIDHERGGSPWEIGQIDNSNGYGPNNTAWPSGLRGMGINLDGDYSHNVYTHLISPTYSIPAGASARLTFNHWVCTEAAWDGGSIFTSVDDGLTWQHYGDNLTGFYERLSQVNTNSPFHGHGIFDGSTVANGCGTDNANQTFQRVSGDISSFAGQDVRVRFSFFSDGYVKDDGWYIDDAGIEIDVFEMEGEWTSPLIDVDEAGWARLTSLYWMPNGTEVKVDVLDVNGNIVPGHENMTLPFTLRIGAWQHDQLQFRVKMTTDNDTITPRVRILHHGITEYFTPEIIERSSTVQSWPTGFFSSFDAPNWRPFLDVEFSCSGNVSGHLVHPWNPWRSNSSGQNQGGQPQGMEYECDERMESGEGASLHTQAFYLKQLSSEILEWAKFEPITLRSVIGPAIDVGADGSQDWSWNGSYGHVRSANSIVVDGVVLQQSDLSGFESTFSDNLTITFEMPTLETTDGYRFFPLDESSLWENKVILDSNHTKSLWYESSIVVSDGVEHDLLLVHTSWETNSPAQFTLLDVNFAYNHNHSIHLDVGMEQSVLRNGTTLVDFPVTISSERGGIELVAALTHENAIVDTWADLPTETFRPGLIQNATSFHEILDGQPALESVNLKISTSSNLADTIAEITVDDLGNGGRFIQNQGAGVIAIDSANSSYLEGEVIWSLQSHWLLDDYTRLYWFAAGTNAAGITLGPAMETSGSGMHAASTNDLEVVDFSVFVEERDLMDDFDVNWPQKVAPGSSIDIEGVVRFSGLGGEYPDPGDLELSIELNEENITHLSIESSIDSLGRFNSTLVIPMSGISSGAELIIKPVINRVGPNSDSNAQDVTDQNQMARFVLDSVNGQFISLDVMAPGGNQPADGHIWHPGQDIPLQLHVIDDNGLPASMTMYINRNDRGWESIPFLTPEGQTDALIDLPLIDESQIPLPNQESGWVDIYFIAYDLAGNGFAGGGTQFDVMARLWVENRHATWIEGESLYLDRTDEYLFPGTTHVFNWTISDDNGLDSIDEIILDLAKDSDGCEIEWYPWKDEVIHDSSCFLKPPRITANQRFQVNTWDVKVEFEVAWHMEGEHGVGYHVPSLVLRDENAPLGAGFSSMSHLAWYIHSDIDLRVVDVLDKTAPLGSLVDDVMYIHGQDMVDIEIQAFHAGYLVPAENLPFTTTYTLDAIGSVVIEEVESGFNSDGSSTTRMVFSEEVHGAQVKMILSMVPPQGHIATGDSFDIVIDDSAPTLSISSGYLTSVDSNNLDGIPIEVTLQDTNGIGEDSVIMHWTFMRQSRLLDQDGGIHEIPFSFGDGKTNLYSSIVDLDLGLDLAKGDTLIIWFEAEDASGRPIEGTGSNMAEPFQPILRWVAYEPAISDVVTNPYRPQVGDVITITFWIGNQGVLDGNSTVSLLENGVMIEQVEFNISSGMQHSHVFEVEAWGVGDLGLTLQIDDGEMIPIPLANVEEKQGKDEGSQSTILGLAVLSVFLAGLALLAARARKDEKSWEEHEFDHEEE